MCKKIALPIVFILMLSMVAPAMASEDTAAPASPAAATSAPSATLPTAPPEPLFLVETGTTQCYCRCTCLLTGSFENQCVSGPANCDLNGQACHSSVVFELCADPEVFQGCVQAVLAPKPCV